MKEKALNVLADIATANLEKVVYIRNHAEGENVAEGYALEDWWLFKRAQQAYEEADYSRVLYYGRLV